MPTPTRRDGPVAAPTLTDKQAQILSHLREQVDGTAYFKAKYIAEELGLSPKEVGINMGLLQERTREIDIEQWGRSDSTTWKVTA